MAARATPAHIAAAANDADPQVVVVKKRPPLSGALQAQLDLDALCQNHNISMRPLAGGLFFAAPAQLIDARQIWSVTRAMIVTCCLKETLESLDACIKATGFFDRLVLGPASAAGDVYIYKPNKAGLSRAALENTECSDDPEGQAILTMIKMMGKDDVFQAFSNRFPVALKGRRELAPNDRLTASLEAWLQIRADMRETARRAGQIRP